MSRFAKVLISASLGVLILNVALALVVRSTGTSSILNNVTYSAFFLVTGFFAARTSVNRPLIRAAVAGACVGAINGALGDLIREALGAIPPSSSVLGLRWRLLLVESAVIVDTVLATLGGVVGKWTAPEAPASSTSAP